MTIEQEIQRVAIDLLKECTDDYHVSIWNKIGKAVIIDVKSCVDDIESNGFTDGDVKLAIGRALTLGLN